jgi:endonuclease G
MSARSRRSSGRVGRAKVVLWFNVILLAVLGGWFVLQPPVRRAEVAKLVENYFEKSKRIELVDVALDIYQLYYSPDFVRVVAAGDRTHVYGGVPKAAGFPHAVRVLKNTGYIAGYCEALENPVWVAYRMSDVAGLVSPAPRPESFEADVRTVSRVQSSAYTNSGYDRGHLAPNYGIATRYGPTAQRETFLMSNITPQRHALNAGIWKELEMKIATSYPGRFGDVWVLTGPVFEVRPTRLPAGPAVPEAFFMVLVDESDGRIRTQAFLFPQETQAGVPLERFVTTIDEIERRTGLDFLSELEDVAEESLESKRAQSVW